MKVLFIDSKGDWMVSEHKYRLLFCDDWTPEDFAELDNAEASKRGDLANEIASRKTSSAPRFGKYQSSRIFGL